MRDPQLRGGARGSHKTHGVSLNFCKRLHDLLVFIPLCFRSFKVESTVKLSGQQESGVFSCMACGGGTCEKDNVNFFVTTLEQGFQISGPTKAIQGDRVDLLCEASKYNYTDSSLVWCKQTPHGCEEVKKSRSKKSRQPGGANEEPNLIQV